MAIIALTRGLHVIVDDEDMPMLSKHTWWPRPSTRSSNWYAYTTVKKTTVAMHRMIMGNPVGSEVDHINRNGLDNRRSNLRLCNRRQNCANSVPNKRSKSGFIGVYEARPGRFRALVQFDGKNIHGGYYDTAEEAARSRDEIAIRIYGDFATLNFPRAA